LKEGAFESARRYLDLALRNFAFERPGAFYGSAGGRALGAGLIYRDVLFPHFNSKTQGYDGLQGPAYVLTHECDIDQSNARHFNDLVLVCPLILFKDFVAEYEGAMGASALESFVTALAKNDVSRVFFLPPTPSSVFGDVELTHGALLYLNQLCHTPVSLFSGSAVCALSTYGLERLDAKFQSHLFRPKAEPLPNLT
jgi:hypothetical protein